MRYLIGLLFVATTALFFAGCGGGGGANGVSVTITPVEAIVRAGAGLSLSATVTGTDNHAVTWTVEGGSANGAITAAGAYTAPPTTGRYRVIATSVADPARSAIATIQVIADVTISVPSPTSSIGIGRTTTLAANVVGTTNTAVDWTVEGGATKGTITADGVYTAPNVPGTFTVTATSRADRSKSASATVDVAANARMAIAGKGDIVIQLRHDRAPKTVANFAKLVNEGFYDGIRFHRYGPDEASPIEVVQGGDPNSKTLDINDPSLGTYNAGYTIDFENSGINHVQGVISMAATGTRVGGSTQFFFCRDTMTFLDTNYASFGMVISGMDVMMALRKGDTMTSVRLEAP